MKYNEILWWISIAILIVIALTALVLSCLSYQASAPNQPHHNLSRDDICVSGCLRVKKTSKFYDDVNVFGISSTKGQQIKFDYVISTPGTFNLPIDKTNVRIETFGSNNITLVLPLASVVPGFQYQIFVSQSGAGNTILLNVSTGDFFCTVGCTAVLPVYTSAAGSARLLKLTNDGLNSWFLE